MLNGIVSKKLEEDKLAVISKQLEPAAPAPPPMFAARSRSLVSTRRVTPTITLPFSPTAESVLEKLLPNGDLFIGSFSGNAPHGLGKYLWTDGCMYEGDWRRGKASGKGKFSWPSGATYEGEFKSGRMEGFGTFIGSDGDTYRGMWSSDRKHGYGQKRYANGDFYEGLWKRNLQEGQGRYVWRNGNEYVGEWKNGIISGRGVLTWLNGNRYEGQWENGIPKGDGIFTWPDGSSYNGSWNKDLKLQQLTGTFYLGTGKEQNLDEYENNLVSSLMVATKKRLSADVGASGSLTEKNFPRICIWESEGEAGDITCDIIDNVDVSMICKEVFDSDGDDIRKFLMNPCCFSGEVKKPGETISKGHKNYDLMLHLQLGIRYSVGKHAYTANKLKASDFDPKKKFWTRFPPEGSKATTHQFGDFWWKDYCPVVFRHLREHFQLDMADYMLAICGNDALREFSSPGKSGSFFYLTQDDRFMIKTVKKSEVKMLIRMLSSYYRHVCHHENSLITKFYGVHCVKPAGAHQKTRFIVMGNVFCSKYRIHRRFDLKGSSHGRTTDKLEDEIDETTTLKDLDLSFVFRLQQNTLQELIKQVERDCEFLESEKIMDYSLLVGLHFREDNKYEKMGLSPQLLGTGDKDSFQKEVMSDSTPFFETELEGTNKVLEGRKPLIKLGMKMPARAERMAKSSDLNQFNTSGGGVGHVIPWHSGEIYEVVLYFGIIDILQDYDISKKLEHAYKSLQADPTSISAVDPKLYSKRFRDFIRRIFIEDR